VTKLPDVLFLRDPYRAARRAAGAIRSTIRGLARDTRAGVAIMLAISLLALAAATGAALDFARGLNFKTGLQGAIDSAALAGATEYLNSGSATQAQTVAQSYVTAAIGALPPNNGVTTSVSTSVSGSNYNVTVTASGSINTSFVGVLEPRVPVSVTSTASATGAPNINFYLLLDSSPSMGIAATTDGINTMIANTQYECDSPPAGGSTCGCAFACHESNPSGEQHCNATSCTIPGSGNPGGEDNYALSQSLGVTLRIDNLREAVQSLMSTAQSAETTNNATYQMAIYTFDVAVNTIQTLTSSLTMAASSAANIQQLKVYSNNWLTSSNNNSDTDTDYTDAMTYINSQMPTPGNGTNARGDTPQEVLFFVTDGVEDENVSGSRVQSLMNTSYCTTIKNRGIRIAVLYTEYLPIPANGWYNTYISPFQSQIASNMQSCASPGLFFQVTQGGDISAALAALFQAAIKTAHLIH
jgi:Flp pilus assembly protein TadG